MSGGASLRDRADCVASALRSFADCGWPLRGVVMHGYTSNGRFVYIHGVDAIAAALAGRDEWMDEGAWDFLLALPDKKVRKALLQIALMPPRSIPDYMAEFRRANVSRRPRADGGAS